MPAALPTWLVDLSILMVSLGLGSMVVIVLDMVRGRGPKLPIMYPVWLLTALYAGPLAIWAFRTFGQRGTRGPDRRPQWQTVLLAATHCGSGCTLGDITAEIALLLVPFTILGHRIFASWVVDFLLAFTFGIAFQYFTIVPMRQLSPADGLKAAVRADALSLTAWQVGMYGWMALVTFVFVGRELSPKGVVFWAMMQLGMLAGLATSAPVNAWLLRRGVKEPM
jgi:hypothetical protein